MAIWGKILGGAAGFMVGQWLGAVVGAAAGHVYDRMRAPAADKRPEPDLARETAFAIAVIVLGAKMAKADGRVTADEIRAFRDVFHVPAHEMKNVGRLFNQARRDSHGYEPYARQLGRLFRGNPAVLEKLIDGLFHIALSDGVAHPAEIAYLAEIARIVGFDKATFERIQASHLGPSASDPYALLGVARNASDQDLRSAWRRLIRENHPDTLIAQGLPKEFVDIATDKMARINAAYDEIRAQRGLA